MEQASGALAAAPADHELQDFARRYTDAWNSHDAGSLALFFEPDATYKVNDGEPYTGAAGIARMYQETLAEYPDFEIILDGVSGSETGATYLWTFVGTYVDTGRVVRLSGTENWTFSEGGLIKEALELYDANDLQRQLTGGAIP